MTTFCDLHGCLVDFVGQCNKTFDVDIYSDPAMLADWHAPAKVIEQFVDRVSCQDATFWSEMPLLPNAHKVLASVKDPIILTTPWGNAASYAGTRALIEKHFPDTPFIFADKKHVLAAGNTLIDDKEENIDMWRRAGGIGILHPGLMNRKYRDCL